MIKTTADGNKLLCLQMNFISDLWLVDIVNDRCKQITFTEDFKMWPRFSPNGKRIAFFFSDDQVVSGHIYVMDSDGQNRKQLSPSDEYSTNPLWSPNGRWITYNSRKISEPADSVRTYLLDMSNPGPRRYIADGRAYYWIDSARFQIIRNHAVYITSIDRAPLTRVYDDSTFAHYTVGGMYIIYADERQGVDPNQWWIVDGTGPRDVQRKNARKLIRTESWFTFIGNMIYWSTGIGEVWRMTIPDGKPEKIKANLLGVDNIEYFGASWDGKEVIVGKWRWLSKMMLIENLFK
jgi:Tol biopolymer transport system component